MRKDTSLTDVSTRITGFAVRCFCLFVAWTVNLFGMRKNATLSGNAFPPDSTTEARGL